MLTRIFEVESVIRDSIFHKIEFQFEYYSSEKQIENAIKFSFIKFDKELIELVLVKPSKVDLFDDNLGSQCISHIKAFRNASGFEISFDPYDERIEEIQERDNYVFQSKSYEIHTTKI